MSSERTEIIEAGIFLDANVARTLWKALVVHDAELGQSYLMGDDWHRVPLPKFSTDVDDVQRVIGHMKSLGWTMVFKQEIEHGKSFYLVSFVKQDNREYLFVKHTSMEVAICLAALSAHGGLNFKAS